jgi:hypothetical protein
MIKHIVMWKLDEQYSPEEKKILVNEFRQRLLQLEGNIAELKEISVRLNTEQADKTNFDMLLDTTFNTIEDLNSYAIHPEHLKVVEFAGTFKKVRSCIDYEI